LCGHIALIDISSYPAGIEIPSLSQHMKCSNCGGKRVDVRPNWKERPTMPTKLHYD
jgi:hypothetical protein